MSDDTQIPNPLPKELRDMLDFAAEAMQRTSEAIKKLSPGGLVAGAAKRPVGVRPQPSWTREQAEEWAERMCTWFEERERSEEALRQMVTEVVMCLEQNRHLSATRRWNVREVDGVLLVCRGDHDKHDGCVEEEWVRKPSTAMLARLLKAVQDVHDEHWNAEDGTWHMIQRSALVDVEPKYRALHDALEEWKRSNPS